MNHASDLPDTEIEHVAAGLWALREEGADAVADLEGFVRIDDHGAALDRLIALGHAVRENGRSARLTASGDRLAVQVVRRHRLAELLFSTVFDMADDGNLDRTACLMEHILSSAVTDSVCSFLGHPKACPHGKPIPAGECCRSFSATIEPLVQPLEHLAAGGTARIVYIVPKDPSRLVKLSNLGIVPGATLRLEQKRPAVVVALGETTMALDRDIAGEIYVKKIG